MRKVLLFLAVTAILTVSCQNNNPNNSTQQGQEVAVGERPAPSSQIAYINLDSLLSGYDYFIEKSEELEAKVKKADGEMTSKMRSFERAYVDFQEKQEKGLLTRSQMQETAEKLQRQQNSLQEYEEKVRMELGEEQTVMMNNVFHNITSFLNEFNADYRYGMILTTSGGSPVIHADPALNITSEVLRELNANYAKEK